MRLEFETEQAKQLATRAGAILLDHYTALAVVSWKKPEDPVTAADKAVNDFLGNELKRLFPDDPIISEEEPDDLSRLRSSRVWIIDPMDGTREFVDHLDEFAVMIGLAIEGTPCVGVVYQPTTRKPYSATRGTGAYLDQNGHRERLYVSPESNPSLMTIAVSRSHHSSIVDVVRERLGIRSVLVSGSFGLKIGVICERRAHVCIYPGDNTHQWDTCAPEAILREAGGIVTDLNNESICYNQAELRNAHGVIATNRKAHQQITRVTRDILGAELKLGS